MQARVLCEKAKMGQGWAAAGVGSCSGHRQLLAWLWAWAAAGMATAERTVTVDKSGRDMRLGVRLSGPACCGVFLLAMVTFSFYDEKALQKGRH